jgi:S-DNA-T family DNA segregation ATPase FtsK/SpoIIIE
MSASTAQDRNRTRVLMLFGLGLVFFGVVALLSVLSFSGHDGTWFQHQPPGTDSRNWFGRIGATLAEALLQLFGVAALLMACLAVGAGGLRLRRLSASFGWSRLLGYSALVLALCSLLDLLFATVVFGGQTFPAGGYVGAKLAGALGALLGGFGAGLFSAAVIVGVVALSSYESFVRSAALARRWCAEAWRWFDERQQPSWRTGADDELGDGPVEATGRVAAEPQRRPTIELAEPPGRATDAPAPVAGASKPAETAPRPTGKVREKKTAKDEAPRQRSLPLDPGRRGFSLPSLDMLHEPEPQSRESEQALLERAQQITEKFREFSIDGTVVAIHPGPVVTTFEFKPDAGVKYSKITGMTDDLSLAMKAESVRIDRLPGRSTVGIEVPNRQQETIFPRELIGSERFRNSRSKLTLALGKNIHGEVYCAELDRMPHLLIAGATGAGKSVGLNGMIVSMLYKATPEDLRFIMIDTKMIELGVYQGIPHLLIPVVTEPKHASTALQWAVREMELRYRKLASVGLRNIAQFNALIKEEPDRTMEDPKGGEPIPLTHMPYIVIVIDEMADLMMVSSADVEESVMRLAQMARAVGLHLILATQRPSVDVITGTIKANFPSRIAFRVSQRVDSRTIIDQQGAEHLLGKGDMLLLPTGASRVIRLHSGFITEPEINRITSYLKRMAQPEYDESVLEDGDEARGGFNGGERDEMYLDAVRTVITEGKCSITLIQRRLQLGYARAARIVDMMEQEGVVSPGEGSKPREVLVGSEILETLGGEAHRVP